jgi:1-acyl-sn-glycerol-3-phosphate acyltransferase
VTDLYTSGSLFHGPTFQLVTALKRGPRGATATLDLGRDGVDPGALRPGVLDAALHAIPHDDLRQWFPDLTQGMAAYPSQVRDLVIYEALPTSGTLRVEVRPMGMQGRWPVCGVQVISGDRVVASLRLWEVLLPKGPLGEAAPGDRQRFLRDRAYVPGMALSKVHGDGTMLEAGPVRSSDWLPGTVAAIYGVRSDDVVREVAVREHAASRFAVHPSAVVLDGDRATTPSLPCTTLTVAVKGTAGRRMVSGEPTLDLTAVEARWRAYFGAERWPTEDLYYSLVERFVEAVELTDPAAFAAISGRPAIYLANHQTGVESLLFSMVVGGLTGVPVVTIAKAEHRQSWLGRLIELGFQWPNVCDPRVIAFFERDNKEDLGRILRGLGEDMAAGSHGMLVHVEGTRATSCATPVQTLSGSLLDLAIGVGVPVVPVRFVGGLPREPLRERVDFPVGMGKQRYVLGAPILPGALAALPLKERKQAVLDAINALAPKADVEQPLPGDPALGLAATAWSAARGVDEAHAVLWEVLRASRRRCPSTTRLVRAVEEGRAAWADTAEDRWLAELARRLGGPM